MSEQNPRTQRIKRGAKSSDQANLRGYRWDYWRSENKILVKKYWFGRKSKESFSNGGKNQITQ